MSFEIILLLYIQIFVIYFTYNYTQIRVLQLFLKNKVVVNKSKQVLSLHKIKIERDLKLSAIWPILVLFWLYDKIKE
mgnify:CR=1 FL=1